MNGDGTKLLEVFLDPPYTQTTNSNRIALHLPTNENHSALVLRLTLELWSCQAISQWSKGFYVFPEIAISARIESTIINLLYRGHLTSAFSKKRSVPVSNDTIILSQTVIYVQRVELIGKCRSKLTREFLHSNIRSQENCDIWLNSTPLLRQPFFSHCGKPQANALKARAT